MTAVMVYSRSGMTIAAADVLVSSKEEFRRIQLPTRETPHVYESRPDGLPTTFVQKITMLSPQVVLCWARSVAQAADLARHLKPFAHDHNICANALRQYPEDLVDRLDAILLFWTPAGVTSIDINISPTPLLGLPDAWFLGKGKYDAEDYTRSWLKRQSGLKAHPLQLAVQFMGTSMFAQASNGYGLDDAWGGGFQLLRSTQSGFEFIDKLLIRGWVASGFGNELLIGRGPFFYYFYIGEMLMVCRPYGQDGGSLASIPPLLDRDLQCQFTSGEYEADLVLDAVFHPELDTGATVISPRPAGEKCSVIVAPKSSYSPTTAAQEKIVTELARSAFTR